MFYRFKIGWQKSSVNTDTSFVGMMQFYIDKTAVTLIAKEIVAYPVHSDRFFSEKIQLVSLWSRTQIASRASHFHVWNSHDEKNESASLEKMNWNKNSIPGSDDLTSSIIRNAITVNIKVLYSSTQIVLILLHKEVTRELKAFSGTMDLSPFTCSAPLRYLWKKSFVWSNAGWNHSSQYVSTFLDGW